MVTWIRNNLFDFLVLALIAYGVVFGLFHLFSHRS